MRDLKVTRWHCMALRNVIEDGKRLTEAVKNPILTPVVATFFQNSIQVLDLSSLLNNVFFGGKLFQLAETNAFMALTGLPFPKPIPDGETESMPPDVIAKRDEFFNGSIPMPFGRLGQSTPEYALQDCKTYGFDGTIELLMSLQVVAAWTVFETLFGDLWEAALNAHPNKLSDLKGAGRQISTKHIQRHGYDLSDKMGTLLKMNSFVPSNP